MKRLIFILQISVMLIGTLRPLSALAQSINVDETFYVTGATSCVASSITNVNAGENAKALFGLFVQKGLSQEQAAGILGNIEHESAHTFDPRIVEFGFGFPRLMDTMPPNTNAKGQPGYGIVQWTNPARKKGLETFASSTGRQVNDLAVQGEYVIKELEDEPSYGYADLKSSTTPEAASEVFLRKYERPAGVEAQVPIRAKNARKFFELFGTLNLGSPTTTPAASSTTCESVGASNGAVAGSIVKTAINLAWPDEKNDERNSNDKAKPEYVMEHEKYNPTNKDLTDCGVFVATVMRSSGADSTFPLLGTANMQKYVKERTEKYEIIENVKTPSDLKPGDVMVYNDGKEGHIMIYVGPEGGEYDIRHASLGNHVPEANKVYFSKPFIVARLK